MLFISGQSLNQTVIPIINGTDEQLAHRLDYYRAGDIPRIFNFLQESQLVFVRLNDRFHGYSLWQFCVMPFFAVTRLRVLHRVGSWVRLIVEDIYGQSIAFFRRFRDWLEVHLLLRFHELPASIVSLSLLGVAFLYCSLLFPDKLLPSTGTKNGWFARVTCRSLFRNRDVFHLFFI